MTAADSKTGAMGATPSLSLCMIVKNEEFFLSRCLSSVKDYVDEIILVDTGSTDETKAIAAQFTDKIYDFAWIDDFSAARNYALDRATCDWILVLDADEWMEDRHAQSLRHIIADTELDAFFLTEYNYSNNPLETDWEPVKEKTKYCMDYAGYRKSVIARLFRNRTDIRYQGRIHEVIDETLGESSYATLAIPLHHHGDGDPTKPQQTRQLNYLRMMEDVLQEEPSGRLFKTAASVYMYYKHDYRKAADYFQRAVDLNYEPSECLEGVAEAHYRLDEPKQARDIYLRLLETGYASFSLYSNLANLLVKTGQYSQAAQLLKMSLAMGELDEEVVSRIQGNINYLENKFDSHQ
jgi:glycosyltransferase involved in cell wall biosynthesis